MRLSTAANRLRRVTRLESVGRQTSDPSILGPQKNLRMEFEQMNLRLESKPGARSLTSIGTFQPNHGDSRDVLVEWREYETPLTSHSREASTKRADNLARILSKQPVQDPENTVRTLNCAGYFITDDQVGFVFDLPDGTNPRIAPVSLLKLMYEDGVPDSPPPLEERYALSKSLCKGIYYLHMSQVVHKGFRSDNILFFQKDGENQIQLAEPYITGFNHSRPGGPNDPTMTRTAISLDEDLYRHSGYNSSHSIRSTKIHDIYSLGLVLLEVAQWAHESRDTFQARTE